MKSEVEEEEEDGRLRQQRLGREDAEGRLQKAQPPLWQVIGGLLQGRAREGKLGLVLVKNFRKGRMEIL